MRTYRQAVGTVLVSLVLALIALSSSFAQPVPVSVKVALVDISKISANYEALQAARGEIEQWHQQQQVWYQQQKAYLQELANRYSYLPQAQFKEVLDILAKPRPLSQELAKRRDELQKQSGDSEARHLELQAKLGRTDKEREEFEQLQAMYAANMEQLTAMDDDLNTEASSRKSQMEIDLTNNLLQAVKDVATAGGYAVVLNKLVVVYGGDDISDTVIAKLNGKGAPAPTAAPKTDATTAPAGAPKPGTAPTTAPTGQPKPPAPPTGGK